MIERELKYGHTTYPTWDFDSMSEIASFIESHKDYKEYALTQSRCLCEEPDFYGVTSFDEILKRLRYGDEGMTMQYLNNLKENKDDDFINDSIHMDIEGFAYDMGAVVSGEPECCVNSDAPSIKPHLNIYIDTGYRGAVSPEIIANRGVAIYQLISNLISKGYILDIWIVHFIDCVGLKGSKYCQRVKLSTEYLTISQLAFAGKCEFFRVVTWLLTAIQGESKRYTGGGRSMPTSDAVREMQKDGLFIPSGYTDDRFNNCSKDEALRYVTEIYNKYMEEKCV